MFSKRLPVLALATFVTLIAPLRMHAGLFGGIQTYDSGGYDAVSVATADFNGDHILDLVVANSCISCSGAGDVAVLLGNGDGTFGPPQPYPIEDGRPRSVAVADVNRDGKIDVVIAKNCLGLTPCTPSASVLLGNGDGSLQTQKRFELGSNEPTWITASDLNGDGNPDLLVSGSGGRCFGTPGNVWVLAGNGDGSFQTAQSYYSGGCGATSVAVADVNGDKKADLLVTNICASDDCINGGIVGVLLGNGDGSFQAARLNNSGARYPSSVTVADVNRDGKKDIVVADGCVNCDNGGFVGVLLGNGDGNFQPATIFPSGGWKPIDVAVRDVSGDGKLDVVVTNCGISKSDCIIHGATSGRGWVAVLRGNGDGTFQTAEAYLAGGRVVGNVIVADLNKDKKPDVVVANACPTLTYPFCSGVIGVRLGTARYITTTRLVSSRNPSLRGQEVTLTARVSSPGPIPNGKVTFKVGGVAIGSATLSSGVAKLTTKSLPIGTLSVTAIYGGNTLSLKSVSSALIQVVNAP